MTKPQIWVAAFLFLFLLLFMLGRLTKDTETGENITTTNPVPQTEMSSKELSAHELMIRLGCTNCHGRELTGSGMGPTLIGTAANWSRDNLINYLRNPSSYMDSDRFKAYREKYPGTIMPPFNNVNVQDLGKIADYILTLK